MKNLLALASLASFTVVVGSSFVPAAAHSNVDRKDIVDTATGAGNFKTLVAAVEAAGLTETLKGTGPFTVFAPTDEAFAKLPAGTVETLLKPENKAKLASILTYHVVPSRAMAKDVTKMSSVGTVNGQHLTLTVSEGVVKVNSATVVRPDIECTNGVIHVVDQVVLPATDDLVATAKKAGTFGTLLAALRAAGLADTLATAGPFTVFAPTDEAFAKLPKGTVESLLKAENKEKLAAILKFHVVNGRVYSNDAVKAGKATTLQGQEVKIESKERAVTVNGARIVKADIDSSNGVIHVIDAVILPRE